MLELLYPRDLPRKLIPNPDMRIVKVVTVALERRCTEAGCEAKYYARDLCASHYMRQWKRGNKRL